MKKTSLAAISAAFATTLLTACGGHNTAPGGSGGGGGGSSLGGAAVAFTGEGGKSAAVSQAVSLAAFAQDAAALANSFAPAAGPALVAKAAKSENPCTTGSLTSRSDSTGAITGTTFADADGSNYSLGGADFADCVLLDSKGSQGGISNDTKISVNGPITSGSLSKGADSFALVKLGDSADQPLRYAVDTHSSGTVNGNAFDATAKATFDTFYRFDAKYGSNNSDARLFGLFKFDVAASGSSGGQSSSGGAKGSIRYGKSLDDRFKVAQDSSGLNINGSYAYDLVACSGEIAVETVTALVTNGNGTTGTIKLTTGGNTVTVDYEGSSIIINKGQSDETAFTQQQVGTASANSTACAGALGAVPFGPTTALGTAGVRRR